MKHRQGFVVACLLWACASWASAATLIDGTTQGLYNQGIGTSLNGTSSAFPTVGDPTLTFSSAPNLSAASAALGSWLTNPAAPGGTWTGPQAIPATWAVGTETAIIYAFNAGAGLSNVVASFGIDNGIFVWMDGTFLGGAMAPGSAVPGEFQVSVPSVGAGTHYLQVLREDHGGATGYAVSVAAAALTAPIPEPGTWALLATGLLGLGSRRRWFAR